MRKLFIIIVTYNGASWIERCLDSCRGYEVIIVDNKSTDATVRIIKKNYPGLILLEQNENLGFGQANNIAIRYALNQDADHVFLLNQDAYLLKPVLENLTAFQIQNPQYGILSPIHVTGDQRKLDKNFSNYMLREYTGAFYSDFVLRNNLPPVYDVPFVNAAAWLISKSCLETVGGFDPLFFHYGEDNNYCQRILFHGFKLGVLPESFVIHDRDERARMKITAFSSEYYANIEKKAKVIFANVNAQKTLDLKIAKLKKTILKFQLKIKFNQAANYKKELAVIMKIKPIIEASLRINKKKGPHYL